MRVKAFTKPTNAALLTECDIQEVSQKNIFLFTFPDDYINCSRAF